MNSFKIHRIKPYSRMFGKTSLSIHFIKTLIIRSIFPKKLPVDRLYQKIITQTIFFKKKRENRLAGGIFFFKIPPANWFSRKIHKSIAFLETFVCQSIFSKTIFSKKLTVNWFYQKMYHSINFQKYSSFNNFLAKFSLLRFLENLSVHRIPRKTCQSIDWIIILESKN